MLTNINYHALSKIKNLPITKRFDPIYWCAILLSSLFLTTKYQLTNHEIGFIFKNINKHRWAIWINIIGGVTLFNGLELISVEELKTLISLMTAPAFITGAAWYAITFGGVQQKLIDAAIIITFWIFAAFTLSLTTMAIVAYYILSQNIAVMTVILFINFSVILSAILYDNIDGLRIGLDEALKANSQATLRFLKKHYDITPPAEGKTIYEDLEK